MDCVHWSLVYLDCMDNSMGTNQFMESLLPPWFHSFSRIQDTLVAYKNAIFGEPNLLLAVIKIPTVFTFPFHFYPVFFMYWILVAVKLGMSKSACFFGVQCMKK